MRLENSFEVAAPVDVTWRMLNDVPVILPCMPGAELAETVSENAWKARLHVKLGPISLQFVADVSREEIDEQSRRVVLLTKAREARGRGSADARIESSVTGTGAGTRVDVATDLELRGAVAQYGRGILTDVASSLTTQFADCLARKLSAPREEIPSSSPAPPAAAKPVNGVRLVVRAVWRSLLGRRRRGAGAAGPADSA